MNIGVAIDKWKLSIFEKILDREGFEYTQGPGVTNDTLFLHVKSETVAELQPFIIEANNAAARSRDKRFN
jgi:hypothetical protein